MRTTGIGMSAESVVHAFEMFHQAAPGKPYAAQFSIAAAAIVASCNATASSSAVKSPNLSETR